VLVELRFLGAAGIRVSSLALGTMGFGVTGSPVGTIDADGARHQVALALDAGVTLFDTADAYQRGQSEELLGAALGRRRDDVLISTKVHARTGEGPNDVGLSRWHILRACEGSLRRLRTDRIDLYHVHGFDACTPIDESLDALDQLVRDGKVRYLACSNQAAWQIAVALGIAERNRLHGYVALQAYYSLVARELEWDLLPFCQAAGLGVLVWSPLAAGLLAGKASATGPAPPNTRRAQVGDLGIGPVDRRLAVSVLDALRSVAAERGVSVAQVALNWVRSRRGVTSVIVGARDRDQLADNLGAAGWQLEAGEVERLDAASSRPLPYPHWFQRQFTAERFSRDGPPPEAYRYPGPEGPTQTPLSDEATADH
jgi:aryl-alcohol dehydrogenase-like predicted oxidoreductase